ADDEHDVAVRALRCGQEVDPDCQRDRADSGHRPPGEIRAKRIGLLRVRRGSGHLYSSLSRPLPAIDRSGPERLPDRTLRYSAGSTRVQRSSGSVTWRISESWAAIPAPARTTQ